MTCRELTNTDLLDLTSRETAEPVREKISLHLIDCISCRKRLAEIRTVVKAFPTRLSSTKMDRLDEAVLSLPHPKPRRHPLLIPVAASISILCIILLALTREPGSPDTKQLAEAGAPEKTGGLKQPEPSFQPMEPLRKSTGLNTTGRRETPAASFPRDVAMIKRTEKRLPRYLHPPREEPKTETQSIALAEHAPAPVEPPVLCGDWNGDGVLDVADRLLAGRCLLEGTVPPAFAVSDVNRDGTFDVGDLGALSSEIVRAP